MYHLTALFLHVISPFFEITFGLSLYSSRIGCSVYLFFFFQAEDGIRDLVRSRGLGDVYKRQGLDSLIFKFSIADIARGVAICETVREDLVEHAVA